VKAMQGVLAAHFATSSRTQQTRKAGGQKYDDWKRQKKGQSRRVISSSPTSEHAAIFCPGDEPVSALGILQRSARHFSTSTFRARCTSTNSSPALCSPANYLAYFLMAIPAALARANSVQGGIIIGLTLIAAGAFWFVAVTQFGTYSSFLAGLFILAAGMTVLRPSPILHTVLGPTASSATRINIAQTFNGVGWILGPIVGGHFVFGGAGSSNAKCRAVRALSRRWHRGRGSLGDLPCLCPRHSGRREARCWTAGEQAAVAPPTSFWRLGAILYVAASQVSSDFSSTTFWRTCRPTPEQARLLAGRVRVRDCSCWPAVRSEVVM